MCYPAGVTDCERIQAKLNAIHDLYPVIAGYLPAELRGELAAHLYVLPFEEPTAADIRRGQQIARTS
jgi:hypothetical protein